MRDDKVDDTQFFGQVKPKDVPAAQAMDNSMTPLEEYEAVSSCPRLGCPSSTATACLAAQTPSLLAQSGAVGAGGHWFEFA